jgi:hypothetical protein
MNAFMLRLSFLIGFFGLFALCMGQPYQTAVGMRLGYPTAISAKHFLSESKAVEAYVGTRGYYGYRWVNVSAAFLHHQPLELDGVEDVSWYVGAGASAFFWSEYGNRYTRSQYSATSLGIQGYLGAEYLLDQWDIPLAITVDWVPTVFLGRRGYLGGFRAGYGTLGLRYILK